MKRFLYLFCLMMVLTVLAEEEFDEEELKRPRKKLHEYEDQPENRKIQLHHKEEKDEEAE